jgi:hypothetical protein
MPDTAVEIKSEGGYKPENNKAACAALNNPLLPID